MGVAGVSSDEDAVLTGVSLRNALPDVVRRMPVDGFPFNVVRAQDLICHALDVCL